METNIYHYGVGANNMKMLIVEDDPLQRRLLEASLTRAGYDVVQAEDGAQAWEILQRERISLVITDWMMPTLSGLELIRRIREANFPNYTYIILVTAKDRREDVVNGLECGADDYLTKPFDPNEMRARVKIGLRILSYESQLRDSLNQLHTMATYDSLTNLFNRRAVYERAQTELERAGREGRSISIVMLDIDHFKDVNDKHGHLVGDQALRMVASTIAQSKRSYDLAGRWGGEEFLLVLPATGIQEASEVAERMRKSVAVLRFPLTNGDNLKLRVSLGVSSVDSNENFPTLGQLIQQADDALYGAKHQGRNRVCLHQDLGNRWREKNGDDERDVA
jgi:two-component system, cell cycle response regulator